MPGHEQAVPPLVLETVRALVTAWRTVGAYPRGHPRPAETLATAYERVAELTRTSGSLVLGVDQRRLHFGAAVLESPHAERLAQALYERDVAVLRIETGVAPPELELLLRLLATPSPHEERAPLWTELTPGAAPHISASAADYSEVRVTDELGPASSEDAPNPASLTARVVRTLMARGALPGPPRDGAGGPASDEDSSRPRPAPTVLELVALLREVLARPEPARPGAGDALSPAAAVATGVADAVVEHLSETLGSQRLAAARQSAELILALPREMRESITRAALRVLAGEDAAPALQAFAAPFAPEEIVAALRQLEGAGAPLSRHALLLLRGLALGAQAVPGAPTAAEAAAVAALRAELVGLFRFDDVDRYNPEDHQALLEQTALGLDFSIPVAGGHLAELGERVESLGDDILTTSLVRSILDMLDHRRGYAGEGSVLGRLDELFRLLLGRGRLDTAIELVEHVRRLEAQADASPEARQALDDCIARMGAADTLVELVAARAQAQDATGVATRRLVDLLGATAVRNLIVLLVEETNRSRRRYAFDLLAALGPAVIPHATRYLEDPRWYVVRNMIALLRAVGDRASLETVRRCADAEDARVRLEALRSLLAFEAPGALGRLRQALNDPTPAAAIAAIALAAQHGSAEMIAPLLDLLAGWDPWHRRQTVRVESLRALGRLGAPEALPHLRRFLRSWSLPPVSREERRTAFRALEGYPEADRRPWVERGLRDRDAEVRQICTRLAGPR